MVNKSLHFFLLGTASLWLGGLPLRAEGLGKDVCKKNFDSFKELLAKNPHDEATWNQLRVCTNELKRWNEAASIASDALAKDANIADAHLVLGITELHAKVYPKAAEEFRQASTLNSEKPAPYYYLGMADLFLNNPSEAAEAAEKAVTLDPRNATYHSQLAYADYLLGENDQCEAAAKKAVELDPNNVAAYKVLGNLYKREGRTAESDKAFEDGIHANGRIAAGTTRMAEKHDNQTSGNLPGLAAASPAIPSSAVPSHDVQTSPVRAAAPVGNDPAAFCKHQWEDMRQAVENHDYEKALTYFSDYLDTREQYRQAFKRLGSRLPAVLANVGELDECEIVIAVANCKASVTGQAGTINETVVRFERNTDSVWRIKSF